MTTKCTGLKGRIFGHKWVSYDRINKQFVMGYRFAWAVVVNTPKDIPERGEICQRCGVVTGEKK